MPSGSCSIIHGCLCLDQLFNQSQRLLGRTLNHRHIRLCFSSTAKQRRGGRQQMLGPGQARPREHPSMEEEWRGHKQKKRALAENRMEREREWRGWRGTERRREERGGKRMGHDGTQVPQWRIESFKEPKHGSPLNTKAFHGSNTATETQLQSFEAPEIYGGFQLLVQE